MSEANTKANENANANVSENQNKPSGTSRNPRPSKNTKAPRQAKKNKRISLYVTLVAVCAVVGLIIALIKFFGTEKTKRNASITIEFTYEGAARNLTPDGVKFSINDIMADSIIEIGLASVDMLEKYSVEDIRNSMTVSGQYPSDVISQLKDYDSLYDFSESRTITLNDYYPTIYQLQLYDDFDPGVSESTMRKIVKAIAENYRGYFINRYRHALYTQNLDNILILGNYDFSQRIKVLKYRMNLLEQYAGELYKADTNYKYNGMSFNDLLLKCRSLKNDTLGNMEATIMIEVLSTNANRLKNQYLYEIQLLENEKTYKETCLSDLNSLIEIYQTDGILYIPSGDSVVKVDSNSKETYEMLMARKKNISERLVAIDADVSRYKGYLEDMGSASYMSSTRSNSITEQINNINERLGELENTFKEMLGDYNSIIVDDNTVLVDSPRSNSASLFSGSFILMVIKCAGPFCIIALVICLLHATVFEIRRYRKNELAG